ncbi:MAG: DUF4256 domain-containing protein [Erysipelotrichaceae bacterium]|nr:DUF4256 domain-containing protein [Erysipelotrichaceae bacterium]
MKKDELLVILKNRFENNTIRHENIKWVDIEKRLNEKNLSVLLKMEETGGEPDVIGYNSEKDVYIYCDCSKESPVNRRSLCYDFLALESRKANKPSGDAQTLANQIGVKITNVDEYNLLQSTGDYDLKTSSWLDTPNKIRSLGGALFGDKRYDTVFTYHNGAESYYSARGFRGILEV